MTQHATPAKERWFALHVFCDGAACEAIEYGLTETRADGTTTETEADGTAHVTGFYRAPSFDEADMNERIEALHEALLVYGFNASSVFRFHFKEIEERDWMAEWKKNWQPVAVGRRFLIAPSWSELNNVHDHDERIVIRIDPGMAFGTGTHETTRLCLAAIEKHFDGESFLDVGTGAGILAIAAAKLRAGAHIEACDTDAEAISIARENAELNNVAERISFRVGTVDETTASADFVCANLTADAILPLLPALLGATCRRLVLSGILVAQLPAVRERLNALGAMIHDTTTEGEWAAIIV